MRNKRLIFIFLNLISAAIFITLLTTGLAHVRANNELVDNQSAMQSVANSFTSAAMDKTALTVPETAPNINTPVDCNTWPPPIVGYEISKGQLTGDVNGFLNDLVTAGYNVGTVDLSAGPIPSCVDILIILGLAANQGLSSDYMAADGATLQTWVANGHSLALFSDWGARKQQTQALFQTFGYTVLGDTAVSDPTDFDPLGPGGLWVIYQPDNFAAHPILSGVSMLELLLSAWLTPATDAIVTTDADAIPPSTPVMAAFSEGQGCVVLSADSNWVSSIDNGYLKENPTVALQMIDWLNGCSALALGKSASSSTVQAGQLLTYTMPATNYAAVSLSNVRITDTAPAGTTFVSASNPHTGPGGNGVVTWNFNTMGANSSATATMTVQINSGMSVGSVITNTAYIDINGSAADSATVLVTVTALPPTAVSGGPYNVNEGSVVSLNGSGSTDPNNFPLSFAWDLDNDGLFDDATGAVTNFSAAARDDGVYPVSLLVDNGTFTDTNNSAVTVLNVAPQVTLAATSWQILAGQSVTFTGVFTDPGVLDTHQITWNYGAGGGTTTGSLQASVTYPITGTYTVTLTVSDDDGGVGQTWHTLQVNDWVATNIFLPIVANNICTASSNPLDVILAMDISSSMNRPTEPGGPTRLAAAKVAAATFINLLNFPADQAGIVSFGNGATLEHKLSVDAASLQNKLQSLTAGGSTRMDLALIESKIELTGPRHRGASTPAIILLTDGRPNGTTNAEVLAEAAAAKAAGIAIYTIGLGDDVDVSLMQSVASDPTNYYHAPSTSDLNSIYQEIASQIHCN